MRTAAAALVLAAAGCVSVPADTRPTLGVDDVSRMHAAGVDEGTLLARIWASRLTEPVTANDILRLKNEGVADRVIQALAEAAPTPVTVVERPVYVEPSFRYGYDRPYRYWGSPYWRYGYRPRYHAHPRPRYYSRPRR